MRAIARLMLVTALASSAPALAGEEVLYQPAPEWVDHAALPAAESGPALVLFDDQRRIEAGLLSSYVDRAIRIDNAQMLAGVGTIQAQWLPDKGDLIVHEVSILREGETIDVLGQGALFEVLRRERQLEQRMLDGAYTATLAVPGLRVGDVLRVGMTTTMADQALGQEVQTYALLPTAPFEAGFLRLRMSWPADAPVTWEALGGIEVPPPVVSGGFKTLEVPLPLAEPRPAPQDAPARYQMPPMLQAGTFDGWSEVSRVMGPLYATESTIAVGGPLGGEVAAIVARHERPLERAVAALRLVQDEVTYLLNGMEGGNYIPQSPAQTWELRYGDCKAKTMLLLAMLREMGIEAEAVAVAASAGDAVRAMLPMPGAFDHVIVHAVIDGTDYWLDGTSSGASLETAADVPPFHVALPLRPQGAELIAMPQRPREALDLIARVTIDQSAGLDVPSLFTAEWVLSGPTAAPLRAIVGQTDDEQLQEQLRAYVANLTAGSLISETGISFDEATNKVAIRASGLTGSEWQWERGTARRSFALPSQRFEFRPDRARAAWREIPVAMAGPFAERTELDVILPPASDPYVLEGKTEFETQLAGVKLARTSRLAGSRLSIADTVTWPGGELAAEEIAGERQKVARFGAIEMRLQAPQAVSRRLGGDAAADRKRFAAIEAVYARVIADRPDDLDLLRYRATFRASTLDRSGALADISSVIEREPSAAEHLARARWLAETGELERALADAETAWVIDPSLEAALVRADILPYLGRVDEALELLQDQQASAEDEVGLTIAISDLEAQAGLKEEGLQRIEDQLGRRPNDPGMLNARCWYRAIWNVGTDELVELCTQAVERADWSAPVLDSRAMGYFRVGRYQEALKDLEAALSASPDLAPALFMRGVVRRELGDRAGEKDISEALALMPSLERSYARFGISARAP